MATINKAFVPEEDFKEIRRQNCPIPSDMGTVCHVDIDRIDDSKAPKLPQILATLPGNVTSTWNSKSSAYFTGYIIVFPFSFPLASLETCCLALFGAFVLGTYLGWCSPVQPQLKLANGTITTAIINEDNENVWHLLLDEDQMSWVGSLINVGAVVGCLCGGFLMDSFGRKAILAVVFLLYTAGWLLITLGVHASKYDCITRKKNCLTAKYPCDETNAHYQNVHPHFSSDFSLTQNV